MPRLPLHFARRPALLAVATLAVAASVAAGPCLECPGPFGLVPTGFWNDRALSPAGVLARSPRIDVDQWSALPQAGVVWEERGTGDGDIVFARSADGGCSWQQARLTAGPEDDLLPDVALSERLGAVVVVFVRAGQVWSTASDDAGLSFSPPEAISGTAPVDALAVPRVAGVSLNGAFHVHVVWASAQGLYRVRSLAGGAPGSFEPAVALSDSFAAFTAWSGVDVAADTRSSNPATYSGVTIAASGLAPGSSVPQVFVLRSLDSGTTFHGDPTDPASLFVPRAVSDPRADDPLRGASDPILDGSDDGGGVFHVWNVVLWTDSRSSSPLPMVDARAEEGVTPSVIGEWNDPPASADAPLSTEPSRAAAVAVLPNPLNRPPEPDVHFFFTDDAPVGALEVNAARGYLKNTAVPTVATLCPAYRLTGVSPSRPAGDVVAGSIAADEDLSHVFIVWADSRDGLPRVSWKRSDTVTSPPTAVVAAPMACASGGGIEVTWALPAAPPHCDVDHVRVDYGLDLGAPDGSVDVPGTTRVVLSGLVEGATYHVRVTTVDEACNEASAFEVSAVAPFCNGIPPCPNPVGASLRATRGVPRDEVLLTWGAPPVDPTHGAATSYDIHRSDDRARDGYALRTNVPATALPDAGAIGPSTPPRMYYLIVARNACGTSGDEPLP